MKPINVSAETAAMVVNTALVVAASALCWKLKRMAPALILLFMMSTRSSTTTKEAPNG